MLMLYIYIYKKIICHINFYLSISSQSMKLAETDIWPIRRFPLFFKVSCCWCQQWRIARDSPVSVILVQIYLDIERARWCGSLVLCKFGKVVSKIWSNQAMIYQVSHFWDTGTWPPCVFSQTTSVTSNIKWFTSLDETSINKLIHIISFQNSMSSEIHKKWCAMVDINPQMFEVPLWWVLFVLLQISFGLGMLQYSAWGHGLQTQSLFSCRFQTLYLW